MSSPGTLLMRLYITRHETGSDKHTGTMGAFYIR